jgi:chemotaxis response regulator CheB
MENYRVLVVDDEPLIRSLLEKYFKSDPRFEVELRGWLLHNGRKPKC